MKHTILKAAAVVALSVATAGAASAQTGLLNVVGQAQLSSTSASAPLFIDFLTGANFPPTQTGIGTAGTVFAGNTTGIFAGVSGTGTMNDLTINATGTTINTVPAGQNLLTIGQFTFTLGPVLQGTGGTINFGPIVLEDRGGSAVADLNVQGRVSGGVCGNMMCTYTGIVTAQFAGQTSAQVFNAISNGQATPIVTFSANFAATQVIPEPSTYALLATGIGALGFVARRRRQQA
jgi:hypothetical protein